MSELNVNSIKEEGQSGFGKPPPPAATNVSHRSLSPDMAESEATLSNLLVTSWSTVSGFLKYRSVVIWFGRAESTSWITRLGEKEKEEDEEKKGDKKEKRKLWIFFVYQQNFCIKMFSFCVKDYTSMGLLEVFQFFCLSCLNCRTNVVLSLGVPFS